MVILGYVLLGLAVGSFLGAFTYRYPKGKSVLRGRSFCPLCRRRICWHENVPLVSYALLGRKCRGCKKSISVRYPLIELTTALGFGGIYYLFDSCSRGLNCFLPGSSSIQFWYSILGDFTLPFLLFLFSTLVFLFVVDFEEQIIPDRAVFIPLALLVFLLTLFSPEKLFLHLLAGFLAAGFLLLLHLITKGKGMGLGDVKFALFGGLFLGWPGMLVWLFASFVIGAVVGIALILLGKASFGQKIAFGPFLIVSLVLISLLGTFFLPCLGILF